MKNPNISTGAMDVTGTPTRFHSSIARRVKNSHGLSMNECVNIIRNANRFEFAIESMLGELASARFNLKMMKREVLSTRESK